MASRRITRSREAQLAFDALQIEGGLLSPEWLSRIAQLTAGAQSEADYRVPKGLNLRDEIGRYWRIAQAYWGERRSAGGDWRTASGAGLGGPALAAMLREVFGFASLAPVEPITIAGRSFPLGHAALAGRVPVVIAHAATGLDTPSPEFGDDGRRRSAFGLAQEYLNAAEGALWGVATDGVTLRILRDNASLTRPAWIEADLARIFSEERYADFAVLWLLLHETRFGRDSQPAADCPLESWREAGRAEGTRAREYLRQGVEEAVVALGQGFLAHPANQALATALREGSLSDRDYFAQLLRLVYRLIFLLTVEERGLLHPREREQRAANSERGTGSDDPPFSVRHSPFALYANGYSLRRLCQRALKRSAHDRFSDLWQSLKIVLRGLAQGEPRLGLPALAGLFAPHQCPDLDAAQLENRALLLALFKLAWLRHDGALARVNWRDMGPEELGSVYESLLELVPQLTRDGRQFGFASTDESRGNARKTSGSYYTPDSLVQVLLDTALEPVIAKCLEDAGRLANGEWRTENGSWQPFDNKWSKEAHRSYVYRVLSRSGSVAACPQAGAGSLSSDLAFPGHREVRAHVADASGGGVHPLERGGGVGTPLHGRVHPVPEESQRQPSGTGDTVDLECGPGFLPAGGSEPSALQNQAPWPEDPQSGAESSTTTEGGRIANGEERAANGAEEIACLWRSTPFAVRHSLFAEQALLALSIVDPACGSGHFLLAAARRLASHVARLQANGTPSGPEYRHALRQVVGRCIHGVDLNPMAVELCKVSLWMEAVDPGLPLTFLNSHIQHGNALLGATPDLMAQGIPDAAWEPLEGDDRKIASALKKRNKQSASGQRSFDTLWSQPATLSAEAVTAAVRDLEAAPDADPAALARKEARWDDILASAAYRHQKFVADAWCAAFVWPKQPGPPAEAAPTNELWRQIRDAQGQPPALTSATTRELASQFHFFHWHLQFPLVFAKGGFDVVLGNPPWEQMEISEEEWFASRMPEISAAPNAAARKKLIATLKTENPALFREFARSLRAMEGANALLRSTGQFPLCAKGRINTYAVFAEHNRAMLNLGGAAGCVVPAGIATDDTTKEFFQSLVDAETLHALLHFENEERLFVGVNNMFRFVLLTMGGGKNTAKAAHICAFARNAAQARDPQRRYTLSAGEIASINPNTRTFPTFHSRRDADINLAMYRRAGILWRESDESCGNPWGLRFLQGLFNMASDSGLFRTRAQLEAQGCKREGNHFVGKQERFLPLFEAKMVHHFDHRFATYEGATQANLNKGTLPQASDQQHSNPDFAATPEYWVDSAEVATRLEDRWSQGWLLGWRDITNAHNERTVIASLIPRAAVGHKLPLMLPAQQPSVVACLYASLCSFALDYAARQKVGGTSLTYFIVKQLPVLAPSVYGAATAWDRGVLLRDWVLARVLELTYTAWDLEPFAKGCLESANGEWRTGSGEQGTVEGERGMANSEPQTGLAGYWQQYSPHSPFAVRRSPLAPSSPPPFRWDAQRRFLLRCELDAAFFHLYGLNRDDTACVMDTFPIVRKHDEKEHGEYRTKRAILEIYDAMAEAVRSGHPYATRLDPPPADPACCHPSKP